MKVLFITQLLPYPPNMGGKVRAYQTIRLLSRKHQIFLISFVDKERDLAWEKRVEKLCYGLKTFVTPIITTSHKKLKLMALLGLFHPKPFRVQKYFLGKTADFIRQLTKKENFEVIYCDNETSIQYLGYAYNWQRKIKVYDEHNISSEGLFGYAKYEKNPLEKFAYLIEGIKFWFYEKRVISMFDWVLTISETDRQKLIERGIDPAKIKFLPTPFEIKPQFHFGSKNILFIGLLSWWPNKDAVLWFYHRIFPLVKEKMPQAKLLVVGANPPEAIKRIGKQDPSVVVTGYVKDINPYFKKAGVFIVPIRAGAGVRIKVLDALSRGLPVVSTILGIEGIDVRSGRQVLIADKPEEFVKKCLMILNHKKLSMRLSRNGIDFIKKNYSNNAFERTLTSNFFCKISLKNRRKKHEKV